jgi:hypothetical protein
MKDKKNSAASRFAIGALVAGAMLAATLVFSGKIFNASEGRRWIETYRARPQDPAKAALPTK